MGCNCKRPTLGASSYGHRISNKLRTVLDSFHVRSTILLNQGYAKFTVFRYKSIGNFL